MSFKHLTPPVKLPAGELEELSIESVESLETPSAIFRWPGLSTLILLGLTLYFTLKGRPFSASVFGSLTMLFHVWKVPGIWGSLMYRMALMLVWATAQVLIYQHRPGVALLVFCLLSSMWMATACAHNYDRTMDDFNYQA